MANEEEIHKLISKLSGSDKTVAEFLGELFKDRLVEIYAGDAYEDINIDQTSTSYPATFCGKVIGAYKECLIINSITFNDGKKFVFGGIVFIHEGSIKALNEAGDEILENMFLRSREAKKAAEFFKKGK